MSINPETDEKFLEKVMAVGGYDSENKAIIHALHELAVRYKQREIFGLFGQFAADDDYDYKKGRK